MVSFLLSVTPGPSILYIMARSVSQGTRAGISAVGGMAVGSSVYVLATVLGVAAIFQYSPLAYTAIKVVGAVYLVYLGWQYLTSEPLDTTSGKSQPRMSNGKIFRQSIVVELTNPKSALFFLALLPQFVDPERGSVATQLLVLGMVNAVVTFICDSCVALLSGRLGGWLNSHPKAIYWQDRIAGGMLVSLGAFIGFESASDDMR